MRDKRDKRGEKREERRERLRCENAAHHGDSDAL